MDVLLAIIAAAVLIWLTVFMLRGSLLIGGLAVILVGSCFGYPFWHPDGVPISLDRALIALLGAMYLVHRRWGMADPKPMGRPEWVLIALIAVLAFSTFTNDWHDHNNQPATHLVLYWLMPAAVYWIARQSPLDERTLRQIFGTLAVFGVYLA